VALPPEVVRTHVEHRVLAALPIELELRLDRYGIVTRRKHPLSPGGQAMLQALRVSAGALTNVERPARQSMEIPVHVLAG
jgi:DNA-binding transcriptional LysR family regulator